MTHVVLNLSVTIQMKASERYTSVFPFSMLYMLVLSILLSPRMKSQSVTIQMKTIELHFPVRLLNKVVWMKSEL